jgi:hypothetical protein
MDTTMDIEKSTVYQSAENVQIETHPNLSSLSDEELLGIVSRTIQIPCNS